MDKQHFDQLIKGVREMQRHLAGKSCLLYTSDAADERSSVDLGGRRIIKKKRIETVAWGSSTIQKKGQGRNTRRTG